jgi:hypothetical protein
MKLKETQRAVAGSNPSVRHASEGTSLGLLRLFRGVKWRWEKLIGPSRVGMLDYFLGSAQSDPWGGPFNGQKARQQLFRDLLQTCRPEAIVETGTYLGISTEYMAKLSGLPLFTVEVNPRRYGFVKMRLRKQRNVQLSFGDSRKFLNDITEIIKQRYTRCAVLFYLDAHGSDDLPLEEEISIVFSSTERAIVLIDDFQVPYDLGYGYDDYGRGNALTVQYIARNVERYNLAQFFPTTRCADETGARRGCAILACDPNIVDALQTIELLRRWHPS